jgi:hypothetical protein
MSKLLLITRWADWQRPVLKTVVSKRMKRGTDMHKPYSLPWFAVSAAFADHGGRGSFLRFAELVGGRAAETFWIRVLQYVAATDPFRGSLAVRPETLGRSALARPWDGVSADVGRRVYQALIDSGLAEEIEPSDARLSVDASVPTSPYHGVTAGVREERRGDTTPSPSSACAVSDNGNSATILRGSELAERLKVLYRTTGNGTELGRAIMNALALRNAGDVGFDQAGQEALVLAARS